MTIVVLVLLLMVTVAAKVAQESATCLYDVVVMLECPTKPQSRQQNYLVPLRISLLRLISGIS